jgi:signal transduction histidine kinase
VEAHGMTLISHIPEGIQMNTNRQAFTQLVNVLMDNAVKYTTDNGEILFSLSQDGHNIILTEENSCETEMNDDPERLFERFYRFQSEHISTYHT